MANIIISELRPAGADLFDDFESYMTDLSDSELDATKGGISPLIGAFAVGYAIGAGISLVANYLADKYIDNP